MTVVAAADAGPGAGSAQRIGTAAELLKQERALLVADLTWIRQLRPDGAMLARKDPETLRKAEKAEASLHRGLQRSRGILAFYRERILRAVAEARAADRPLIDFSREIRANGRLAPAGDQDD